MKEATAGALAAHNARIANYNGGTLVFYAGTQPATPDAALSGNTALLTLTFSATAFGAASQVTTPVNGYSSTGSFVSSSGTAGGSGTNTVTFARAYKSDGTTTLADFSVGTSGTDAIVPNTSWAAGTTVSVTSAAIISPYH